MSTEIAWTEETWNPVTGCDRVSAGCDHCYAMTLAKRLKAMGQTKYQRDGDPRTSGPGFGVTCHPDALDIPLRWKRPRKVFVNSMSDLFHAEVPEAFIGDVFGTMALAEHHTFQVLTKRPQRMAKFINAEASAAKVAGLETWRPAPNVWLGTSVEDDRYARVRIPHLLETPAAVRFLSLEPLIGPVTLLPWVRRVNDDVKAAQDADPELTWENGDYPRFRWDTSKRIDWVIIGGESGPGARPMEREWAQDIVDVCRQYGVAVFVKQLGTVLGGKHHADIDTFPDGLRVREYPA
jgi:protein gp37